MVNGVVLQDNRYGGPVKITIAISADEAAVAVTVPVEVSVTTLVFVVRVVVAVTAVAVTAASVTAHHFTCRNSLDELGFHLCHRKGHSQSFLLCILVGL